MTGGPDMVRLPGNENWIMRPVVRGYCSYESLLSGVLTLEDIARMNDAADVLDENSARRADWNRENS